MNHASQSSISQNIKSIRAHILSAEELYQRAPDSVLLLAVSKTRPVEDIQLALTANQQHFGENYLQDALTKIAAFTTKQTNNAIQWHFIGPIQSNKTLSIAQHFNWVHSIDRLKIAQRLSEQRQPDQPPLNICLQVNTSGETTKSGVNPEEIMTLAKEICRLPNIHLRGLMTLPASTDIFEQQRQPFRLLRELKEEIQAQGIELDTLSMGMTNDMEAAIAEGSTMVRIGTAIFGQRKSAS